MVATLLKRIDTLSPSDLKQVQNYATFRLNNGGGAAPLPKPDQDNDYLLEGIQYELRRRGLLGANTWLSRRAIPHGFASGSATVRETLEARMPCLRAAERAALGQLAARCLASYYERYNRSISAERLLNNVHVIPEAVDCAYPGYLKSGHLPLAIKRR